MMRILSLGAGVQSTTVLLMSCVGELDKLDAAVFADTGWEPRAVYEHLTWLEGEARKAGIPVYRVRRPGPTIREFEMAGSMRGKGQGWLSIPYRTLGPNGEGIVRRQCTRAFKLDPVEREVKRLIGHKPGTRLPTTPAVEVWKGISFDERERMAGASMSASAWQLVYFPLVDLGMTRRACLDWCESQGYPQPPRSACIGCPYRSNEEWRHLRATSSAEWDDAVEFDEHMRERGGDHGDLFIHRSCGPLRDADIRSDEDKGQLVLGDWREECAGMCGV